MLLMFNGLKVCAQSSFWKSKSAYLGQTPPNDTPKIFAKGMLADAGHWAGDRVCFSADGREFYYGYAKDWFTPNSRILYFKYLNHKWTGPILFYKDHYGQVFSMDGKSLYFMGGKGGVWQSHRTKDGWTEPVIYMQKKYGLYDFMPTLTGNMYVGSNGNQGDIKDFSTYNFCRITVSHHDTTIKSLGTPLNAPGFNGDFFIAPDESYMIISDKETKDFKAELFISFHKPDDTWTNPKSLGPLINNSLADRWGEYVSPDHKYLFYTQGPDSKNCFIYWVRFDKLLEHLRHSNFEPYIKNPIKDQSALAGQPFSIEIPGDTFVDDDGNNTLTSTATLSDGQPLPAGLIFNDASGKFTGNIATPGTYPIKITVTDTAKATTSCVFNLMVKN